MGKKIIIVRYMRIDAKKYRYQRNALSRGMHYKGSSKNFLFGDHARRSREEAAFTYDATGIAGRKGGHSLLWKIWQLEFALSDVSSSSATMKQ